MSEYFSKLPFLGTTVAVFCVLVGITVSVYNAFFHPLARFPGPKAAGMNACLFTYHRLIGNQHRYIKSLHEKYGPVVRYLPDTLSYVDPNAWEEIFGHKLNGRGDLPKDMENKMPFLGGNDSIMRMNDADHTRVRRLLAPAFADKALREQQGVLKRHIQLLLDKVRAVAEENGEMDLMRWYEFTAFDIIADLSFGESLGMLEQGEWTPWINAIRKAVPLTTNIAIVARYFPLLGVLFKMFLPASVYKSLNTHLEFSRKQVDKRVARGTDRLDFWKYILRSQNKQAGILSTVENHALGMTLLVAGSDTTAALLGGITGYLFNSPDKYQRLVTEIRGAFSSSDEIDMDKLMQLPYLAACIKEALRLYPPTPLGQQRVVPVGGRKLCGQYVPEGTIVMISHYSAYRLSSYWHKPDEFIPERWLTENQHSGPFANDNRKVYNPFSIGPRNCIGKSLAYHEARLIFGSLLWNFDFELCAGNHGWGVQGVKGVQKVYASFMRAPLMGRPKLVTRANT